MDEEDVTEAIYDAFERLLSYGPIDNPTELTDEEQEKLKTFFFGGAKAFYQIAFPDGDCAEQNYGQRLKSFQRRKKLIAEIKEFLE